MSGKRVTPRNPLEAVSPPVESGDVVFVDYLPPVVTNVQTTNPDGSHRDTVLLRLAGHRAVVRLAGSPFLFEVRVVELPGQPPQIMDLRIYAPPAFGDVAITNADLKAIPLARVAAAAGTGLLTSMQDIASLPDRLIAPEKHTTAAESRQRPARGRGRPRKLTDEFLGRIAEYAREAHRQGQPILAYVAACVEAEPRKQPRPDTVRWWLARARERRLLIPGELIGKPEHQPSQGDTSE